MEERQLIQEEKNLVNAIMWEFRCRDTIPPPRHSDDPEDIDEQERIRDSLEQERKSWAMIYEELARAESTIVEHMEMWSLRATLEQTAAANRLARTSGQLTKIATIIVPCSFVASIFSMGGSFAAGEEYFFVYWTISIPVTVALLAWVLYRDIQEVYEKIREMELLRRARRFRLRRNVVEDAEKEA
ncbi:uncharacterized protein F4812DRAFT_464008 [Daldinia caldariorum]|uniref:uncharacterized protein n=1 Tax=Daldinia caldariorum TaxID=326644 RepID=UPI0020082EF6|nr:uncharacterized protein F4812DRAFT_464008 [Daldinia caldariorum]KAI1463156.1 hypothetical protein F4812DRAFT_464008 [Daldinia caldariorum]